MGHWQTHHVIIWGGKHQVIQLVTVSVAVELSIQSMYFTTHAGDVITIFWKSLGVTVVWHSRLWFVDWFHNRAGVSTFVTFIWSQSRAFVSTHSQKSTEMDICVFKSWKEFGLAVIIIWCVIFKASQHQFWTIEFGSSHHHALFMGDFHGHEQSCGIQQFELSNSYHNSQTKISFSIVGGFDGLGQANPGQSAILVLVEFHALPSIHVEQDHHICCILVCILATNEELQFKSGLKLNIFKNIKAFSPAIGFWLLYRSVPAVAFDRQAQEEISLDGYGVLDHDVKLFVQAQFVNQKNNQNINVKTNKRSIVKVYKRSIVKALKRNKSSVLHILGVRTPPFPKEDKLV